MAKQASIASFFAPSASANAGKKKKKPIPTGSTTTTTTKSKSTSKSKPGTKPDTKPKPKNKDKSVLGLVDEKKHETDENKDKNTSQTLSSSTKINAKANGKSKGKAAKATSVRSKKKQPLDENEDEHVPQVTKDVDMDEDEDVDMDVDVDLVDTDDEDKPRTTKKRISTTRTSKSTSTSTSISTPSPSQTSTPKRVRTKRSKISNESKSETKSEKAASTSALASASASAKRKRQKIAELNDDSDDDDNDKEKGMEMEIETNGAEEEEEEDEDEDEKDEEYEEEEEEEEVDTDAHSINIDDSDEDEDEDEEFDEPIMELKTKSKTKAKAASKAKTTTKAKAKKNALKALKQATNGSPNIPSIESLAETPIAKSWSESSPTPYAALCETLSNIEAISSRLEIQKHLTNLFRICLFKNPSDLITLVYLSSNSVAAAYECVELGIGDAILIKAVAEASGSNTKVIKKQYETVGDLGSVAMSAKGKQRTLGFGLKKIKPLTASEVLKVFRQIASTTGTKSQKWKADMIKGLLVRVQGKKDAAGAGAKDGAGENTESKYIIRGLQGKLRIGLAQSTVLISLAHAVLLSDIVFDEKDKGKEDGKEDNKEDGKEDGKEDNKEDGKEDDDGNEEDSKSSSSKSDDNSEKELSEDAETIKNTKLALETRLESAVNVVKKAYSEVSSFDALVDAILSAPLYRLNQECSLRPGMPVEPMLAKPTKSIQEVLKRLNGKRFTCEYKYDGERAQIHMNPDGVTKVFSRSLLDTSEKYPEVPIYVKEACDNVESFVLDTEVVAYNRETKQFVPFQVLSTRKKTEESEDDAKVKVIVQAFDLMYLNGVSLLDHTLSERRDLMKKHFKAVDGKFQFATALDHTEDGDTTILEDFLDTAVKGQCEGLMVKTLDDNASYQPSYRSLNWLKLKKDYLEGMGDSVDLVPIGAYHGRGKRTGVYGAYLLACYDVDTEEFQSVCKIGTGFSDEDLKSLSKGLNDHVIKEKSSQYNVSQSLECDVWFDACQVWEVKAADLSKSSTHKGAVDKTGEIGRGIGLRFPRFERMRDDKRPDQATSSDQILDMYYAQDSIVDTGNGYADDGII